MIRRVFLFTFLTAAFVAADTTGQAQKAAEHVTVLHAAHMLDVASGKLVSPGEVLVRGSRIVAAGSSVEHPAGAEVVDLGGLTLMPGLIDAHVHLFLHPGAEDLQTVEESVPERVILAEIAAHDDLMAGFTAERDMGTEGAGSADSAVRNAIDKGLIPGPRMRVSGNAISVLGGHEDAIHYNPAAHVPGNADYANNATELVAVIRQQLKEGADFIKIYETGADSERNGDFHSNYQYTQSELEAAVTETARMGTRVGVHCEGEPGALYAAKAGVASIDHADQLSAETMRIMKEKQIYAVPTFAIQEYFRDHAASADGEEKEGKLLKYHAAQFKQQMAAGVPFAVGSDVGPFPHGTQAREMEMMVEFGMSSKDVLQADLLHGARLLDWEGKIGELKAGYFADVIAVDGDPLTNIGALKAVKFVMKDGVVYKK
ncbi:MAG TPA: amidohydrolase family protein [Acidobacteriaceae bacterium]